MGILENVRGEQTISNYLAERNQKESSLYVEIDRAEDAINTLHQIANKIPSLGSSVETAYNTLSNATGMNLIAPAGLPFQNPSPLFESVSSNMREIATNLESTKSDYINYNSSTNEKILSTSATNGVSTVDKTIGPVGKNGDIASSIVGKDISKSAEIFSQEKDETIKRADLVNDNIVRESLLGKKYDGDLSKKAILSGDAALAGASLAQGTLNSKIVSTAGTAAAAAGVLAVSSKLVSGLNKSQAELESLGALDASPKDVVGMGPTKEVGQSLSFVNDLAEMKSGKLTEKSTNNKFTQEMPTDKEFGKEDGSTKVSLSSTGGATGKLADAKDSEDNKEEESDDKRLVPTSKTSTATPTKEDDKIEPTKQPNTKDPIPTKAEKESTEIESTEKETNIKETTEKENTEPKETYNPTPAASGSGEQSVNNGSAASVNNNTMAKKANDKEKATIEKPSKEEYYSDNNDNVSSTTIDIPDSENNTSTVTQKTPTTNNNLDKETPVATEKSINEPKTSISTTEKPINEPKTSISTAQEVTDNESVQMNKPNNVVTEYLENKQAMEQEQASESEQPLEIDNLLETSSSSIEDTIQRPIVKKIPTSKPIIKEDNKTKGNLAIPIGAGLSTAAIAGLGAKAYLDKKAGIAEEEETDNVEGEFDISEEESNEYDEGVMDVANETTTSAEDYDSPTARFMREIDKDSLIEIL